MRFVASAGLIVALAACEAPAPDSNSSVAFQDFQEYQRQRVLREAQLTGQIPLGAESEEVQVAEAEAVEVTPEPAPQPLVVAEAPVQEQPQRTVVVAEPAPTPAAAPTQAETTAAATLAAIQRTAPEPKPAVAPAAAPVAVAAAEPAPQVGAPLSALRPQTTSTAAPQANSNNPTISDEQDFSAVSERETIESDAERLRAQRQAYQVIEPTELPRRSGSGGPNIVAFALATNNRVGEPVYRRSFGSVSRAQRACARYPTSDLAQEAFLASGGPERDRRGVDPDGDGFACDWDPTPFRSARN